MKEIIKEQFGALALIFVLLVLFWFLFVFQARESVQAAIMQVISAVVGGILTILTGRVHNSMSATSTKIDATTVVDPTKHE